MKPTTGTVIKALRSGLATRDELLEHHGCKSEALTTCTSNMLRRELITRYAETVDGKMVSAYRLTELGKAWKPDQRGVSLKKAMQKGMQPESGIGGTAIPPPALDSIFATAPELQYLAPEDYAMPEPDAKLIALANHELASQLSAIRDAMDDEMLSTADIPARIRELCAELTNTRALADKLQHLLDAKTRECEALRANAPECCGKCAPDLETVALVDLLARVATYLDDGHTVTIHASDLVTINAFGRNFVGTYLETSGLLDASAMLRRAEVAA